MTSSGKKLADPAAAVGAGGDEGAERGGSSGYSSTAARRQRERIRTRAQAPVAGAAVATDTASGAPRTTTLAQAIPAQRWTP